MTAQTSGPGSAPVDAVTAASGSELGLSGPELTVNVPLLRKAVEWAEAEAARPAIESEWQQDSWITPPRLKAGILLEDTEFCRDSERALQIAPHCGTAYCIAGWVGQQVDGRYAQDSTVDGVHVSTFAAEALGIGNDHPLFSGSNDIEDVRRIAEEIAGERL